MLSNTHHISNINESQVLFEVEHWIDNTKESDVFRKRFYDWGNSSCDFNSMQISQYFPQAFYDNLQQQLPRFISVYQADYEYSEHYKALIYGCEQAAIALGMNTLMDAYHSEIITSISLEQYHQFVDAILAYKQWDEFSRKASDRLYQMKQRHHNLQAYGKAMHQAYSKLLVIRIDLCYRKDDQHLVPIAVVNEHLSRLLKMKDRGVKQFEDLVGYAWAIEQATDKGYHIHCLFYFNGHKHQQDCYIAQEIGKLWVQITEDAGYFFNCNLKKDQYKFRGIGMIHRSDAEAMHNSLKAIAYLTDIAKTDQYLRAKPNGMRVFGMGKMPKVKVDKGFIDVFAHLVTEWSSVELD